MDLLERLMWLPSVRRDTHRMRHTMLWCWLVVAFAAMTTTATELKPATAAGFAQYVRATEARMDDDVRQDRFLVVDRLSEPRRREAYDELRRGGIYVEPLRTRDDNTTIHVASGLIHHWAGVIFIRGGTLSEALVVLQDYEHQQQIYSPDIRESRLIERNGDQSTIFLQLFNKSVVVVILNAEFDVSDTQFGSIRHQIAFRSTRIAEIAHPGRPDEHELPVGNDHGYMWRLDTYWRIEEKDGGVYIQNESLALTRTVPILLAWLVNPLIKNLPRNVLFRLLTATRRAIVKDSAVNSEQASVY